VARRRLGYALAATVPLTDAVLLAALLAFPGVPTARVLPIAGLVALVVSTALVSLVSSGWTRRGARAPALVRAAVAGLVVATVLSWLPILGALALVAF
jgi:hypothetical protein